MIIIPLLSAGLLCYLSLKNLKENFQLKQQNIILEAQLRLLKGIMEYSVDEETFNRADNALKEIEKFREDF